MKVDIKDHVKNPFLNRVKIEGVIDHEGESTPSGKELKGFLSKSLKEDEGKINIRHIYTRKGMNISDFSAFIIDVQSVEIEKSEEDENEEEESGEQELSEEGYGEIFSGSIPDGKEKISKMKNPDYEELLKFEKNNKDRKGMKKFLEGKLED